MYSKNFSLNITWSILVSIPQWIFYLISQADTHYGAPPEALKTAYYASWEHEILVELSKALDTASYDRRWIFPLLHAEIQVEVPALRCSALPHTLAYDFWALSPFARFPFVRVIGDDTRNRKEPFLSSRQHLHPREDEGMSERGKERTRASFSLSPLGRLDFWVLTDVPCPYFGISALNSPDRSVYVLPGPTYLPGPNCLVLETGFVFLLHLSYIHRHFPNKFSCLHLLTGYFPNIIPCPHLPREATWLPPECQVALNLVMSRARFLLSKLFL